MKKEVLIGFLAVAVIVIAGCTTQGQQSPPQKTPYGIDYQGVLDMLNSCDTIAAPLGYTCNEVCENNINGTCISAEFAEIIDGDRTDRIQECGTAPAGGDVVGVTCYCCLTQ